MSDSIDLAEGLSPTAVRSACAAIGASDASTRVLADTAAAIAEVPRVRDAAIRCATLTFDTGLSVDEAIASWPVGALRAALPPFFDPTILLAGFRRVVADHRRRGIPWEVTRITLSDLDLWMEHHRAATGSWSVRETGWLARHFTSRVFQLGRLQFEPRAFGMPFAVFRSRHGDSAVALAEGGRRFRDDGQFADADPGAAVSAERVTWTSRFVEDARGWRGSAASDEGLVLPAAKFLDRGDWIPACLRGDPVLAVHIPATGRFNGPLTREACADSFRRAMPFFARHVPEFRPRLLACESWMLDPQLARCLPPESNLVSFQRFFQLLPVPGADDRQILERVFGGTVADWRSAPRDTSLRSIVADQAAAGIRWRMGAGVIVNRQETATRQAPGSR